MSITRICYILYASINKICLKFIFEIKESKESSNNRHQFYLLIV